MFCCVRLRQPLQVELDAAIKSLSVIAAAPELYPAMVDAGAVTSLLGLLTHENTVRTFPVCATMSSLLHESMQLPGGVLSSAISMPDINLSLGHGVDTQVGALAASGAPCSVIARHGYRGHGHLAVSL